MRRWAITPTVSLSLMPERTEVSPEVAVAIAALTRASGGAMFTVAQSMLATDRHLAVCYEERRPPVDYAATLLRLAILRDIADAVGVERERCLHDIAQTIIDARRACAETRPILERAAGALAEAQNVHRVAYGAYSRDYGKLETVLELVGAGPVE